MDRPALQQLLADIRKGFIDVVVVYKVDRLSRALADFAKMVELFDAHDVSFVAVTQPFNTTTPGEAWRVAAPEIERLVGAAAGRLLGDHGIIAQALEESGIDGHRFPSILKDAKAWAERIDLPSESGTALAQLIDRVELKSDGIRVTLELPIPESGKYGDARPTHLVLGRFLPMQMKRRGIETRFVLEGDITANRVDLPLLKAIARARSWSQDLIYGRVGSVSELARRERLDRRSVRRQLRLAFLSPQIAEAIVEGRQPPDLTVIKLTRRVDLPALWRAQEQALCVN